MKYEVILELFIGAETTQELSNRVDIWQTGVELDLCDYTAEQEELLAMALRDKASALKQLH